MFGEDFDEKVKTRVKAAAALKKTVHPLTKADGFSAKPPSLRQLGPTWWQVTSVWPWKSKEASGTAEQQQRQMASQNLSTESTLLQTPKHTWRC